MAYPQDSTTGGEQQDELRRRAKTSTHDPKKPGTTDKLEGDEGERAPDDQGNAITDQEVNRNVAERAREQEEEKKK